MILISLFLFAYCLGQFLTAHFIGKIYHIKIMEVGSGNPGARNIGRVLGKKAFALAFIGDFLKGAIPILIAQNMNFSLSQSIFVLLGTILGHLYPVIHKFHGGKGISAFLGGVAIISPSCLLFIVILFIFLQLLLKNVTIAGIIAIQVSPLFLYFLSDSINGTILFIVITSLISLKHKENILGEWKKWR